MMEGSRQRGAGIVGHLLALVAESLRYLKARAVLAGEEAKTAGLQYGIAAAMVVAGLCVAALGYVFLIVTLVFAIGLAFRSNHAWVVVLGVAALVHLGGAVGLVLLAKKRVGDAPFPETLAEIEKDRLWLRQLISKE